MISTLLRCTAPCLATLFFVGTIHAQNPLPNPGFENWTGGIPVGWTTNNNQFTGAPITAETPGHSGTSAARGTYLGLIAAPIINTINTAGQPLAISESYDLLSFYYKLNLASTSGTEIFSAGAVFTNAGGSTVGQAFAIFNRTQNTSTWTLANLTVTYPGGAPTGVNVNFGLNGPDAVVGSYFVLDDVVLGYAGTNGVQEVGAGAALGTPWPVPAGDVLNLPFAVDHASTVSIDVLDALGRTIERLDLGALAPGQYKQVLEVQGWAAGSYTAVLRTGTGVHAQRFAVVH